ncbi:MAG: zinc ribbon domain-containing protein [Kiritimatiellae bacterium]|nr:zinc ribbon domain-containing protein [Kiritimatiellia bacterium]
MKIDDAKDFGRRECPACACEVPANHNRCPLCGYEFPHPTPTQRNLRLWGAAIMLVILLALIVAGALW